MQLAGLERHIKQEELKAYMADYPINYVAHEHLLLSGDWHFDLEKGEELLRKVLIPQAAKATRTPQPVSALRIALQCGGSDSFSGLTGNPLVGEVSKLLLTRGRTVTPIEER